MPSICSAHWLVYYILYCLIGYLLCSHSVQWIYYIVKYTKSLSPPCAKVYSRMFKHGF